MLKKILAASLVCLSPLSAETLLEEAPQIGRYQMVVTSAAYNGTTAALQLYLLDTATGHVWKSGLKKNWTEHDAWIPQITQSPQYP